MADLYFMRMGDGPVKIGKSKDVPNRLRHTQTHCPYEITLLGTLPSEGRMESAVWHKAFQHLRLKGEWFIFSPELARCIAAALNGEDWIGLVQPPPYAVDQARLEWAKHGPIPYHRNPRDWARTVWINKIADLEEDVLCAA